MNKKKYPLPGKNISTNGEQIEWITTKEVAALLRVSCAAVRARVYRRQLSAYQPFGSGKGHLLYFKKAEVFAAIESNLRRRDH